MAEHLYTGYYPKHRITSILAYPYPVYRLKQEDNRDIEIRVVLELLNKIDSRISQADLEVIFNERFADDY